MGLPEKKIGFIAKTVTDVGKAILVVGLASYFFERFLLGWRITLSVLSVVLIFGGIFMYPVGEEGDQWK